MIHRSLFFSQTGVRAIAQTVVLSSLREGDICTVKRLDSHTHMRQRLSELGFINGARVVCLQKSFIGDPVAYFVKGAVIALRNSDASYIIVTREKADPSHAL